MFGLSKKKREKIDEIGIIITALERFNSHVENDDWDRTVAWDFDDQMSVQFNDKRAEAVRQLVWKVADAFHGENTTAHSPEGIEVLSAILAALKKERGL